MAKENKKMTRVTIFPPQGKRVVFLLPPNQYSFRNGILSFTDKNGVDYSTTLPFAVELISEARYEAPFGE